MRRSPKSQRPRSLIATRCGLRKLEPSQPDGSAGAQGRLATAPRRQRRTARRDHVEAERQLERAEGYPASTRQRTAPAVDRHTKAVINRREAHEALRTCETFDRLDAMAPTVGEHQMRVRALNTWKHWADGHPVPDGSLRTITAILNQRAGP